MVAPVPPGPSATKNLEEGKREQTEDIQKSSLRDFQSENVGKTRVVELVLELQNRVRGQPLNHG